MNEYFVTWVAKPMALVWLDVGLNYIVNVQLCGVNFSGFKPQKPPSDLPQCSVVEHAAHNEYHLQWNSSEVHVM